MPEKQKTHNWKDPKTIIAAVSVTALLTLWNTFATRDRQKIENKDLVSTPPATSDNSCLTLTQMKNLGEKCDTVTQTRSS